jgi:hypothetical protein
VRSAVDQVELLRKQQTEREERAAALYEGRLSAYVKQMVGVRRENEALRAQQQELQVNHALAILLLWENPNSIGCRCGR